MDIFADPVFAALFLWVTPGLIVAVAFLAIGIDRIDHAAVGAYAFRPLLIPGILLLWPLVVWRWAILARSSGD
ncbi:hypothetical protein [Rhizobium sp. 18065]|uniref:hypothetical protein n=1 Tax=Rhizobium sp. 18065 TaxID=2681411 RepID=UPI0013583F20|nr:hypothetical protein [Rhizobium sp. 18065]